MVGLVLLPVRADSAEAWMGGSVEGSVVVVAVDSAVASTIVAALVIEAEVVSAIAAASATEVGSEAATATEWEIVVAEVVLGSNPMALDRELQTEPHLGHEGHDKGLAGAGAEAGMKIEMAGAHPMIGPAAAAATVNLLVQVEAVGTETGTVIETETVGMDAMIKGNDHTTAINTTIREARGGIELHRLLLATVTHPLLVSLLSNFPSMGKSLNSYDTAACFPSATSAVNLTQHYYLTPNGRR
jgi:hypothetical protein